MCLIFDTKKIQNVMYKQVMCVVYVREKMCGSDEKREWKSSCLTHEGDRMDMNEMRCIAL
jgi:hypothetical protein